MLEGEDGVRSQGIAVSTARPGYSGTGYVTGWSTPGEQISWRILAFGDGTYRFRIHAMAPARATRHLIVSTSEQSSIFVVPASTGPTWASAALIDVQVELRNGFNTVTLAMGPNDIGAVDLDVIEVFNHESNTPSSLATLARRSTP